jgi:hypothetical protein
VLSLKASKAMLFMRNDSVHKMGVSGEIEIFSQEVQKKRQSIKTSACKNMFMLNDI